MTAVDTMPVGDLRIDDSVPWALAVVDSRGMRYGTFSTYLAAESRMKALT